MPGALDATLRAAASRLLGRYGAPMELQRRAAGSGYNPSNGTVASTVTAEGEVVGVIEAYSAGEIAAGIAEAPDVKVTLAAFGLSVVPRRGDELVMTEGSATRRLQIVGDPERIYSGAEVCLYTVRARG